VRAECERIVGRLVGLLTWLGIAWPTDHLTNPHRSMTNHT
jgi:hypothetical protein